MMDLQMTAFDELVSEPFLDLEMLKPLRASVVRHTAHLAQLVQHLKAAGISEEQIEEHTLEVVKSYRGELLRAIRSITEER